MAIQRAMKKPKAIRKPMPTVKKIAQTVPKNSRIQVTTTPNNDSEGVRQTLSRYCFALDQGRLEEVSELFHKKARFSVSFENGQKHTGRESIRGWYNRFFQQQPGQYRYMRHKIFEPLVSVKGETADATTYFDAESVDKSGYIRVVTGRYDDLLVKEDNQWLFQERTITVFYRYSPGLYQEGM